MDKTNKTWIIIILSIVGLVLYGVLLADIVPAFITVPLLFFSGAKVTIMLEAIEKDDKDDDTKITHEKLIALGFEVYHEDGKSLDYIDDKLVYYKLDCNKPYKFGVQTLKGSLGYDVYLLFDLDRHYNKYNQLKQEVEFFK